VDEFLKIPKTAYLVLPVKRTTPFVRDVVGRGEARFDNRRAWINFEAAAPLVPLNFFLDCYTLIFLGQVLNSAGLSAFRCPMLFERLSTSRPQTGMLRAGETAYRPDRRRSKVFANWRGVPDKAVLVKMSQDELVKTSW
jgi:hypothetical protein